MSQLDEITLLCEGTDQGEDVLLLEAARAAVEQSFPIARRVAIQPAGSKLDLPAAMRAHRSIRGSMLVFAVRDRDFLRKDLVTTQRTAALSLNTSDTELKAYPLHRHCIESYLLDPPFLQSALDLGDDPRNMLEQLAATLEELAAARQWVDICKGTLEALNHDLRKSRASCKGCPTNRQEALAEAQAALARYQSEVGQRLSGFDVTRELDALAADLTADGPLWARVDGTKMLTLIEQKLRDIPRLRGGNLKKRLLKHAVERAAPQPLVEEMRVLLQLVEDVVKGGTPDRH